MSNWKRLSSKIVYQNEHITVHEDEVIRPDGRSVSYAWVETPPAVFVVAINDHKKICLISQERYTTGAESWEVPAGGTNGDDELPAAKRELAEEARLYADHWERLEGDLYPLNGTAASRDIIFIATGLHEALDAAPDTDEVITGLKWVSWTEVKKMLKNRDITDGESITALALAGLHLGHIK
jgi:8-oxo-dGTP pyrophosphatase MutT (NUDIX family)